MKRIAGFKQVQKALENGTALKVYVALDADRQLREKITALCNEKSVPIVCAETMAALGKDCGIAVGAATAAEICD